MGSFTSLRMGSSPACVSTQKGYVSMKTTRIVSNTAQITPTRRLATKERRVFDRVLSEFIHLTTSDAEQLTQYAEAVVRYEMAAKETKKHPTVSISVVNRATGNVTGEKLVRNTAFVTLREAQVQITALARRLLIDSHSAEKRQRALTKRSRALAASEAKSATHAAALNGVSEEQIEAEIEHMRIAREYIHAPDDVLRHEAIWYLTVCLPLLKDNDPDLDYLGIDLSSFRA